MASRTCPHCGATVPARRLACGECGSDLFTEPEDVSDGHAESFEMDDEEYEDFLRREFPDQAPAHTNRRRWAVWILAIVVGCMALWVLQGL